MSLFYFPFKIILFLLLKYGFIHNLTSLYCFRGLFFLLFSFVKALNSTNLHENTKVQLRVTEQPNEIKHTFLSVTGDWRREFGFLANQGARWRCAGRHNQLTGAVSDQHHTGCRSIKHEESLFTERIPAGTWQCERRSRPQTAAPPVRATRKRLWVADVTL